MNPTLTLQPAPLSQHVAHAGGWEKLGWQTMDLELEAADEAHTADEGERGLFS